jgi:hypothetical protein
MLSVCVCSYVCDRNVISRVRRQVTIAMNFNATLPLPCTIVIGDFVANIFFQVRV